MFFGLVAGTTLVVVGRGLVSPHRKLRDVPRRQRYRPVVIISRFPRILGFPLPPVRDGA